jgi:hypothetical protein
MNITPNTLFPGRADYAGPTTGWFGLLHHDVLCEESRDVMERVAYVQCKKPKHEVAVRLHNMIYLGEYSAKRAPLNDADYWAKRAPLDADYRAKRDTLDADYWAERAPLDADYRAKRDTLYADYRAKRAPLDADILAYIKTNIPDCAWNGTELVFA